MTEPETKHRERSAGADDNAAAGNRVHAEHVGSLLRPPELLRARQQHEAGRLPTDRLREMEDRAALDALAMQSEVGIGVVTDGEVRRGTWLALWWEALGGIVEIDEPPMRIEWHDIPDDSISQDDLQLRPVAVSGKLSRRLPLTEIEAAFLLAHADRPFKITMPSPSMTSTLWLAGHSEQAYPTPADMLADVVTMQIAEIDALADRGVTWIQIDSLRYLSFLDPTLRARIEQLGLDLEQSLAQTVALDNQVIAAAHRRGMTVGLHLCRGNNRSAWMATGSYEAVAEQLFGQVHADRLLLEYDTERAGGFEPLRHLPAGTMVVLGLVSSKTPVLESGDELRRRIDEAARYVDPDHLAIGPQCGFASTMQGNALTPDDQRRKLELVVSTAAEVWT